MITTLLGILTWVASNLWVLFLALVPAVLGFLNPLLSAIVDGLRKFLSTVWQGASEAKWPQWLLVLVVGTIASAVGYHYGWQACIDWVHAHFHLKTKVLPTAWWKFW